MKRLLFVLAAGGAVLFGAGCGAPPVTGGITESFAQYRPAAGALAVVLPFANETADMDSPKIVREAFIEGIQGRGCNIMPVEKSDEMLRDNGITQGGQLNAVDPETLKEVLGADYVFYGNVEAFSSKNLAFYVSRWVKAGFKLVYTPKAELLWEAGGEAKAREYHMDFEDDEKMRKAMVKGLVSGLVQSALKKEAAKVVANALSTLPAFTAPGPEVEAQKPETAPDGLVVVPGPVGAPPDLDAAFGRLVASAGIEFDAGFLGSTLLAAGVGKTDSTVKEFLTALQLGVEMGGGKMTLANWRRKGPVYRVRISGEGGSGDLVFRYRPVANQTAVRGADPVTGKPSPALNPMIRGIGKGMSE